MYAASCNNNATSLTNFYFTYPFLGNPRVLPHVPRALASERLVPDGTLERSVRRTVQNGLFIYKCSRYGIQIDETSLDEDGKVSRARQLPARSVQDLDLCPKLEPPTRDEADGDLELPCFTTPDLPEWNPLQDPLVDHMLFGFKEHACRKSEVGRCSVPTAG